MQQRTLVALPGRQYSALSPNFPPDSAGIGANCGAPARSMKLPPPRRHLDNQLYAFDFCLLALCRLQPVGNRIQVGPIEGREALLVTSENFSVVNSRSCLYRTVSNSKALPTKHKIAGERRPFRSLHPDQSCRSRTKPLISNLAGATAGVFVHLDHDGTVSQPVGGPSSPFPLCRAQTRTRE